MAKTFLTWIICSTLLNLSFTLKKPTEYHGFCFNMHLNYLYKLKNLQNCTVVIGDLKVMPFEECTAEDFKNMSFPKLKEVTGYMVVYRVFGLETLSDLFPNLTRIRGNTLLYNYALIVYDMPDLREVSLNGLLKIDRGGVIIWGGPLTCNVDTIDWNAIAPGSRHVLSKPDKHCNFPCSCTTNFATNRCWSNKKCQIFLEGPESYNCSSECFGCRNTNTSRCTLCRQFTLNQTCVSRCPNDTLLLTDSNYCVTEDECKHMERWAWNNTCVSECPINYDKFKQPSGKITCIPCFDCHKTCRNLMIQSLSSIQAAENCVYVNGSLTIHIWSIPRVAYELRYYLKNIVQVRDYVHIFSSISLTSLDFLSSLQRIKGERLYNDKYSLLVYNMHNLQTLFVPNVTQNLKVDRGTLRFYRNPMLCMQEINKLEKLFPIPPNDLDVPQGLNGYSGACNSVTLHLQVKEMNETSAVATFYPLTKDVHYTVLYVRIPQGINSSIVPESCSDFEWFAINVFDTTRDIVEVALQNLRPASNYAICIEQYEPTTRHLSRSNIIKFRTLVGKPEPPFILELVASNSSAIVIRWVNHLDYRTDIIRYELDVILVDILDKYIIERDHCVSRDDDSYDIDYDRHAKVMRPPRNYEKGCESMCGILSTVTLGAMVEDNFEIYDTIKGCDGESDRPKNSSVNGVIQTLALDINGPKKRYEVGGLSPFRDYKFSLRACTKNACSRSARGTVRTLHSSTADLPYNMTLSANTSGYIFVGWNSPKITNGPILSYTIEVYPNFMREVKYMMLQSWCVSANKTNTIIKSNKATKYFVRVCSTTLVHAYICTDWCKVNVTSADASHEYESEWWWSGVLFGIFLCVFSCVVGFKFEKRRSDVIPLFDAAYMHQESEPPAIMLSDFAPVYRASWLELRDLS